MDRIKNNSLIINFKNVYRTKTGEMVLIIYNISSKHFVGMPIFKTKEKDSSFMNSIGFYYDISRIKDYKIEEFSNLLYIKGKIVKIKDNEFKNITKEAKSHYIKNINDKTKENTIDNLLLDKWMSDKLDLNNSDTGFLDFDIIRPKAIYWINFGYGVGSELRKLRPALLWKTTSDKKICTFIPISSKCHNDHYYFHCNITNLQKSAAKIECMQNLSYKRIIDPFYINGKPAYINDNDFKKINDVIQKYYTYHQN